MAAGVEVVGGLDEVDGEASLPCLERSGRGVGDCGDDAGQRRGLPAAARPARWRGAEGNSKLVQSKMTIQFACPALSGGTVYLKDQLLRTVGRQENLSPCLAYGFSATPLTDFLLLEKRTCWIFFKRSSMYA